MSVEWRLLKACEIGDIDTVKEIVGKGTDSRRVRWGWNETPLHAACRNGHMTVVRYLVAECGVDIHPRNDYGNTPLHLACWKGHLTVVQYLIEKYHANILSESGSGKTPLHYACWYGQLTVVQYLVEMCGVDVNSENTRKKTPLHQACSHDCESVVEYLVEIPDVKLTYNGRSDGTTILDLAYRKMWLKVMKILITKRSVNTLDDKGTNPLHQACQNGHLTVVQYLIQECNANIHSKNSREETLVELACLNGRQSIVEYLVGIPDTKLAYCGQIDGSALLDFACKAKWWKVMKILVKKRGVNMPDDIGRRLLHKACQDHDKDGVSNLLDIGFDANQSTPEGLTLLDLAHSTEVIRVLLEKGATPTYRNMDKCFPERLQKDPADMAVKMFVLGNPDAGKSTLVKSIENEAAGFGSRLVNQLTKVKGVDDKTAGIIPHEIYSKSLGRVILYDFAGHREFFAGHDALLRSSVGNSPSVILVVVDISNEESKVCETVEYWLGFLAQQNYNGISKPNLIMIGSHADKMSSSAVAMKLTVIKSVLSDRNIDNFVCADPVVLDCRYAESSSMSNLRKRLSQICQQSRGTEKLQFGSHTFLVFLLDKLQEYSAITVSSAKRAIDEAVNKEVYWTFLKSLDLLSCCKELNKQGSILFMTNSDHPEKSWIILDKATLLSKVNGKLFAPEDFKEHQKIANSTGVVPLSKLITVFPDLDQEIITQFLCHLEFCHEVTDPSVLRLLQSEDASTSESGKFFFFPSLVKCEMPGDLWKDSNDFDYYTGWALECLKAEQFLTSRLLQALLTRLAFQFALVTSNTSTTSLAIQRKCWVWKNGISWANQSGGEAIVEVVDQKRVIVMTRCKKRSEQAKLESVHLRSLIVQTVLLTKDEFCPKVETKESVIYPEDTVKFPINVTYAKCVSIKDVASTVKEGKKFVVLDNDVIETLHLEELLHFEPYANTNRSLLVELFEDMPKHHKEISANFINCIAKCAQVNADNFITMIESSLSQLTRSNTLPENVSQVVLVLRTWKEEMGVNGTCCRLHTLLDQYSIFAGRNPLTVAKGNIALSKDHCVTCTESAVYGESAFDGAASNKDIVCGPTSPHQQEEDEKVFDSESLLTKDDLGSVLKAVWEGRARWYNLGLELGLTAGTLESIQQTNHHVIEDCFRAVLHKWLQSELHSSWSSLARSLRAAPVGLGDLGDQIDPTKKLL